MGSYIKTKPKTLFHVTRIVTIHYFEFGSKFVFDGEQHDFWELVYVDKGSVAVCRDGEEIVLNQGEIVFHRPNEFHSIRANASAPNFFVITFDCPSAPMQMFERFSTRLNPTLKGYVSSIVKEAEKTYYLRKNDTGYHKLKCKETAPVGGEQLIRTYLEQFLIFLARSMTKQSITLPPQEKENDVHPVVEAVRTYLEEHTEEDLRIGQVCAEFGYSRSFISKLFRTEIGEAPGSYFLRMKITRAKTLIRETDLNFAQISARLSFENPQYFSRIFKRHTGMTPTEFKNRAHV